MRALGIVFAAACLFGTEAAHSQTLQPPPEAKVVPFSETLHGETVSDPYRWMESDDADYLPWLRAQGDYARKWLDALPRHAALLKAIEARSGASAAIGSVQIRGDKLFLIRRPASAESFRLLVRDANGEERLLLDPATLDTATAKGTAINYWEASPDGRYVYFGASPGGSELSPLRVLETATAKILPDRADLALFNYTSETPGGLYPQWLPDSSGFFYNRLAEGATPDTREFFLNSRVLFHKVGTDTKSDVLVMQAGHDPNVALSPIAAPQVIAQPGSDLAVLFIQEGVNPAFSLYVAPAREAAAGKAAWQPVTSAKDQVEGFALAADDLYLLRRDRPRGRVLKTKASAPSLASASEVVPESDAVIERILTAKDGLYLVERGRKGFQVQRLGRDGKIADLTLPFPGNSFRQFASPNADGMLFQLENGVTPRKLLLAQGSTVRDTGLAPKPPFPTDAYVAEAVTVTARDGARVPLDIYRRKDTPKDGKRPVTLQAYGAYGLSNDVPFFPWFTANLDTGMIIAVAHVRGGGELGGDWWKAGQKATKSNTWRDAIDSAEWLIANGWTSKGRITVAGASAGGIMAGRAVTERPDLWAGAIADVGILNPLRFEFSPNGETNVPEFGTVNTPEGFKALMAMDAYHAIRDGVPYPPILATAGMNDPRVIVWQPAKFVARMQAASTGGPVIFNVNTDQGHGIGSTRSQTDEHFADGAAFALWAAERGDKK